MDAVKAKIKENEKPEYEAQVELNLELKQGVFEPTQFEKAGEHLSVPQGFFNLTMPDGKIYTCSMLVSTHFSILESSLSTNSLEL
jgi:hypothetical protein